MDTPLIWSSNKGSAAGRSVPSSQMPLAQLDASPAGDQEVVGLTPARD